MAARHEQHEQKGNVMSDDKIKFELTPASYFTRRPCHVCGGRTEKVSILCEAKLPCSDGVEVTMRVCETCLMAGQDRIDKRLNSHIKELEGHARDLGGLVGRLVIPTFDEWQRAEEADGAEAAEIAFREMPPVAYVVDGKIVQPAADAHDDSHDDVPF
jgi:hypothetical protein